MRIDCVTIFPEYLEPMRHALLGKAIEQGILSVGVVNLRDFAQGRHKAVDDTPYGGGPGMVMLPEVWGQALDSVLEGRVDALDSAQPHKASARHDELIGRDFDGYRTAEEQAGVKTYVPETAADQRKPLLIVPTPAGQPFTQAMAEAWSKEDHLVFACGRYEGIDQRVFDQATENFRVREVSIGDYVLIGGEVATLVMTEAIVRLIPGVLGNTSSHEDDSFSDGLLEAPSYTKPAVWRGHPVPEVLTSGNHERIAAWQREQSLLRTSRMRPDLIGAADAAGLLDQSDRDILAARPVVTELHALMVPADWRNASQHFERRLNKAGYRDVKLKIREMSLACEPDNMLVSSYTQEFGRPPIGEVLHQIHVEGLTHLDEAAATKAVVAALPKKTFWYGTTTERQP